MTRDILEGLRGGLIVSCQAAPGTPLNRPDVLAALAAAAERGGAVGIRANSPPNIAAICAAVRVPVIALCKVTYPDSDVYITPTLADARAVCEAGHPPPAIIAFDATPRARPNGADWHDLLRGIQQMGALAMADISTFEEGVAAAEAGADIVATTLSGYTPYTADKNTDDAPDMELVRRLSAAVLVPVFCEGRVHTPEQARIALEAGAFAVVVGTALTAIDWTTRRYVNQMKLRSVG